MADGGETDFGYEHDLDPGSGSIFIPGHNSKLNENHLIKLCVSILTKEQMLSIQVMVSVVDCGIASGFHFISLEIAACDCSIMMLLFSSI